MSHRLPPLRETFCPSLHSSIALYKGQSLIYTRVRTVWILSRTSHLLRWDDLKWSFQLSWSIERFRKGFVTTGQDKISDIARSLRDFDPPTSIEIEVRNDEFLIRAFCNIGDVFEQSGFFLDAPTSISPSTSQEQLFVRKASLLNLLAQTSNSFQIRSISAWSVGSIRFRRRRDVTKPKIERGCPSRFRICYSWHQDRMMISIV